MKLRVFLTMLFVLGCVSSFLPGVSSSAFAADAVLPPSFAGWAVSGAPAQITVAGLERFSGGKAPVLREYGVIAAEQANYAKDNQQTKITLYRMIDPTAAFGAFTFLREPDMTQVAAGEWATYSAASHERVLLVIGNLLLDITSSARPQDQELQALADALGPNADRTPFPIIAGYLPSTGLVPNTEHYVLGSQALAQAFPVGAVRQQDWIGFDKSAEAIIARYHLKEQSADKPALVLIALYPTQQVAAEKYANLDKWITLNPDAEAGAGRPPVYGKRSGAMIALVSGAESREAARAVLDEIRYGSKVTWNEPTHTLTDPNIGTIVVGAIMGTGAIMFFALAAGLGFGGLRLFVKFLLPGKVFDRVDQVEILQLGLTAKPIHAEDFYK
jgi:hypothetical protein